MFAPPPSDAQDSVCAQTRRTSLLLFYGCVAHSGVSMRFCVLWGCHILYLSIDVEADEHSERDTRPPQIQESSPTLWYRGRSLRLLRCSMGLRSLPPGCYVWFLACLGLSDSVQPHPPQTRFAHRRICRLPLPIHTTQLIAVRLNNSPDHGKYPCRLPPLERAMNRAVIAEILRKPVPLAARTHSEDDRVEHLARVLSLAFGHLRRVELCDQWLNLLPKVILHLPDRIKRILSLHIGCPTSTGFCLQIT